MAADRRRPYDRQEALARYQERRRQEMEAEQARRDRIRRRKEKQEESRELAKGPIDLPFCLLVILLRISLLIILLWVSLLIVLLSVSLLIIILIWHNFPPYLTFYWSHFYIINNIIKCTTDQLIFMVLFLFFQSIP